MSQLSERSAKNLHAEIFSIIRHLKYQDHLDVACGTGALLERFKSISKNRFATDYDTVAKNNKGITFKQADFNKAFPFKGKKFDLITAVEIIEHIENHSFFLRELSARLDNNKGTLIISSPNTANLWSRLSYLFSAKLYQFLDRDVWDHINPVIENVFLNEAKKAGLILKKKKYSKCYVPVFGWYLPIRNRLFGNVSIWVFEKK